MTWRRGIAMFVGASVLMTPVALRAQSSGGGDDQDIIHDARTEGYNDKVQPEKSSVALVWIFFLLLSLVSAIALFKDAKRTHLD